MDVEKRKELNGDLRFICDELSSLLDSAEIAMTEEELEKAMAISSRIDKVMKEIDKLK